MDLFKNIEFLISSNHILFGSFFFFFGSILVSFFNVVILRYPKITDFENANEIKDWLTDKNIPVPDLLLPLLEKISLSFPCSHCYACKNPLYWYHNIPIFSYLFLRGKCGHCGVGISLQYPIVEFLSGAILLFSYLFFIPKGLDYFLIGSFLLLSLFVLAAIDLKTFMLPDSLNYVILWFGILLGTQSFSILNLSLNEIIFGSLIGYMSLFIIAMLGKLIKGQDVMGNGDFKLLAALGAFIGVKGVIFTIFASPFVGIFTWIILKIFKKGDNMIPYGPSLIIMGVYYLLFKNNLPSNIIEILNIIS